ncbi:hpaIIM, partial [Symbiodinium sp. KB8]
MTTSISSVITVAASSCGFSSPSSTPSAETSIVLIDIVIMTSICFLVRLLLAAFPVVSTKMRNPLELKPRSKPMPGDANYREELLEGNPKKELLTGLWVKSVGDYGQRGYKTTRADADDNWRDMEPKSAVERYMDNMKRSPLPVTLGGLAGAACGALVAGPWGGAVGVGVGLYLEKCGPPAAEWADALHVTLIETVLRGTGDAAINEIQRRNLTLLNDVEEGHGVEAPQDLLGHNLPDPVGHKPECLPTQRPEPQHPGAPSLSYSSRPSYAAMADRVKSTPRERLLSVDDADRPEANKLEFDDEDLEKRMFGGMTASFLFPFCQLAPTHLSIRTCRLSELPMATEAAQAFRNLKRPRKSEGEAHLHIDTKSTYRWESASRKVLLLDRPVVDVPVKAVTVVSASEEENQEALASTATPVTEVGAGQDLEDADLDYADAQDDLSAVEEPDDLSEESEWVEGCESDQDSAESWRPGPKRKKRRTGPGTGKKSWQLRCGKSFRSLVQAAGFRGGQRAGPSRFPGVPWAESMFAHLRSLLKARSVEALPIRHRTLRLGTDCSGAEAPWFALQLILKELEHQLGWKLRLEHLFACDIEPVSQVFVAQNTRPHALFENLRNRGEMGHCLIADAPVVVPNDLDIYVAGFPCKDFSMLNSNRPCLEGPHAETFHGVVNYIRQHKPATYVLENVVGLLSKKDGDDAPISDIMGILRAVPHYVVRYWRVNSLDYHLPQNRARVYIVGIHTGKATLHRPLARWDQLVRKLEEQGHAEVQDFMLPDSEQEVSSARGRLEAKGPPELPPGRWAETNAQLRQQLGFDNTAKPLVPKGSGWSRYLSARQQDVLEIQAARIFHGKNRKRATEEELQDAEDPMNSKFCAEISRSALYGSSRWRSTPCLTPGSRVWVFNRQRWLLGLEMMALQGFPADELNLDGLEDRHLALLAGNAMSVPVVGLFLYLILANVSFPE